MGYTDPTPIQLRAIPAVLSGQDLIASAQTGTGKTAAFALPIINRLGPHRAGSPRVLVLEPTRELAAQVETAFRDFGRFTDLRPTALYGGVGYGRQRSELRQGADIVVATVGRLLDFVNEKSLRLDQIEVLVLDEVDRMLDMGFIRDVKKIIGLCPAKRQTLLFSATIPPEIEEISRFALRNPTRIEIGRARSVNESVNHAIYPVPHVLKFQLLLGLLEKTDYQSVIIFSRTKHGADKIARRLKSANHTVAVLHANRSQNQRLEALEGFKNGKYEIMVATDIAARGIDVAGVSHVVNYDVPANPEDYVHRIGRTGRAMAVGDAFMLATPEESKDVRDIERFIGQKIPQLTLQGFDYNAKMPNVLPADGRPKLETKKRDADPNNPRSYGGGDPKRHPKGKPGSHWRDRTRR